MYKRQLDARGLRTEEKDEDEDETGDDDGSRAPPEVGRHQGHGIAKWLYARVRHPGHHDEQAAGSDGPLAPDEPAAGATSTGGSEAAATDGTTGGTTGDTTDDTSASLDGIV